MPMKTVCRDSATRALTRDERILLTAAEGLAALIEMLFVLMRDCMEFAGEALHCDGRRRTDSQPNLAMYSCSSV
jgi:hypothetical protein